ncbi:MAG: GldG family protein [Kiritimatiellaeota bacterium]|nr:GldG family protein [Kiritimatiellota bacterium]
MAAPQKSSAEHARARRRARRGRMARTFAGAFAATLLAALVCALAQRLDFRLHLPLDREARPSPRLLESLENFPAPLRATVFMAPSHAAFAPVSRLLRTLQAATHGHEHPLAFTLVDPLRDLAQSAACIANGAREDTLILETPFARAAIPAEDFFEGGRFSGDRLVADALRRLERNGEARLYWVTGHGEGAADDYSPAGFSDIARELRRRGYASEPLHLQTARAVPADAAALIIAAPQRPLAPEEIALVTAHLEKGGRLLYMAAPAPEPRNEDFLLRWGLQLTRRRAAGARTLSGGELLALASPPHPATASLAGSAACFAAPRVIQPVKSPSLHLTLLPVATADAPFVMTAELGEQARRDIGLTPARIVVCGGSQFASNLFLSRRAAANAALFLNLVDWLAGEPASAPDTTLWQPLGLGLDRDGWLLLALLAAGALPALPLVFLLFRRLQG